MLARIGFGNGVRRVRRFGCHRLVVAGTLAGRRVEPEYARATRELVGEDRHDNVIHGRLLAGQVVSARPVLDDVVRGAETEAAVLGRENRRIGAVIRLRHIDEIRAGE
ncbi:hypothetical protein PT2222_300068 [Paraburkholderia tropica]